MDTLPNEAQLALTSFLTALAIGGPIALVGAGRVLTLIGWLGAAVVRRRITMGLLASLAGGAGLVGSGLLTGGSELVAGLLGGVFT